MIPFVISSRVFEEAAILRHGCALRLAGLLFFGSIAAPAIAQSTAPSSITPQTLRPEQIDKAAPVTIPESNGLQAPAGADDLVVTLGTVIVEGGYSEVAAQTDAVIAGLKGREISLREIYAKASEIEAIHARAGYVLARVAIPPQHLENGGTLKIRIIDGFIETVDTSGLPIRIRKAVAARAAPLVGKRHILLAQLEQPLLIAGEAPGLILKSTLTRGEQFGGSRLVLTGSQKRISGSIGGDNGLASALGSYGVNAQVSINSPFGLGEQIYGFVSSGYKVTDQLNSESPVRVLGAGLVLPFGNARFALNPELTFSRTQPLRQVGVPQTRGNLKRFTLRGSYILSKTRSRSLTLNGVIEHIDETNSVPSFATRLSRDRFNVARVGFSLSANAANGAYQSVSGQISQGLGGGPTAADAATGTSFSRLGSNASFTKLNLGFRAGLPIAKKWQFGVVAKAQYTLGKAVFRSEQTALEGSDALSAFIGGITAVDEGGTVRIELARPIYGIGRNRIQLQPYGFAASGYGKVNVPTAIERGNIHAGALGLGLRITIPKTSIAGLGVAVGAEFAHGFADVAALNKTDRFNAAIIIRF